jgi:hypothetical protein
VKKPKPVNPQELQSRYFKLSRQRSRAVYERMLAENEGNREAWSALDKLLNDLNEEIEEMEKEARV